MVSVLGFMGRLRPFLIVLPVLLILAGGVNALELNSCQNLTSENTTYVLTQSVNSSATCFTILANNVTIDGNGFTINYSQSVVGYAINNSGGYNYTKVKDLKIFQGGPNASAYGIYASGMYNGEVTNNTITTFGTSGRGVYFTRSVSNNISGNNITTSADHGYGIYLESYSNSNTVYGNTITTSGGTSGKGIYLYSSSSLNNISGNAILTSGASGSYGIDASSASDSNTFFGNTITTSNSGAHSIYLNSNLNSLYSNTITTSNSGAYGIFFSAGGSHTISSNTITTGGAGSHGIYTELSSSSNTIFNNTIITLGGSSYGIYFQYGGSNNVTNNTLAATSNGIFLQSATGNRISGGSITSQSGYDYSLSGAGDTNNFTSTNFTAQRKIYFYDATSYFNYNNQTGGNIWLKTKVSAASYLNRIISSWNSSLVVWNDTNSTGGIYATYSLTGLPSNANYNVYNSSVGVQTKSYILATDAGGDLPTFTIGINGNTKISVELYVPPNITIGFPVNTTYRTTTLDLNYTVFDDTSISQCWYELNGGANISLPACANTTITAAEGSNSLKVWANDSNNNLNYAATSFYVDTILPNIAISLPRPLTTNSPALNFTATDASQTIFCNSTVNGVTSAIGTATSGAPNITTLTGLSDGGINYVNVTCADIAGNVNTSDTVRFVYDTIPPYSIAACQSLNIANGRYILIQNVSSAGTCFTILANNVTLDGQGYTVNYSQSATGYGINNSLGYDRTIIKNVNLFMEGGSSRSYALYTTGSNGTLTNSTISTYGDYAYGIFLNGSGGNNLSGNQVTTYAGYGYGVYLTSSSGNALYDNTITTFGDYGRGIYLYRYNTYNTLSGNSIVTYGIMSSIALWLIDSSYNNITGTAITTSAGSDNQGIYFKGAHYNTLANNTVWTVPPNAPGIRLWDSYFNTITGGRIHAQNGQSYYVQNIGENNYFRNTNFTEPERIQFIDAVSHFNYNDQEGGSVWLDTHLNLNTYITRAISAWGIERTVWNDTNSADNTIANYTLAGLTPGNYYLVHPSSSGTQMQAYTLLADADGSLPPFLIGLNGSTQLSVERPAGIIYNITNSTGGAPATNLSLISGNSTNSSTSKDGLFFVQAGPATILIEDTSTKFAVSLPVNLTGQLYINPVLQRENETNASHPDYHSPLLVQTVIPNVTTYANSTVTFNYSQFNISTSETYRLQVNKCASYNSTNGYCSSWAGLSATIDNVSETVTATTESFSTFMLANKTSVCGNYLAENGEGCDAGPSGSSSCTSTCSVIAQSPPPSGGGGSSYSPPPVVMNKTAGPTKLVFIRTSTAKIKLIETPKVTIYRQFSIVDGFKETIHANLKKFKAKVLIVYGANAPCPECDRNASNALKQQLSKNYTALVKNDTEVDSCADDYFVIFVGGPVANKGVAGYAGTNADYYKSTQGQNGTAYTITPNCYVAAGNDRQYTKELAKAFTELMA